MKSFASRVTVLAAAVAALSLSTVAAAGGRPDLVQASLSHGRPYVEGELLVRFKPGVDAAQQGRALGRFGAGVIETVARGNGRSGDLALVSLPPGQMISDAMRGIAADATVELAEPNWEYRHAATSNDPLYTNGSLWGMYGSATSPANQYGSNAAASWAAGRTCTAGGTTVQVYVGIIDEGYMFNHEDLAANAWLNAQDPVDGVDNDNNGYVDDTRGWDFANNDNSVFDGTTDDHGTHVAGTISGAGGNGKGVAGVCWGAKLISAKFLGRRGGTTANAIKAIDYLINLKVNKGLNIVASNNSWGGGGYSQELFDAIERSKNANMLFIAAAGNSTVNNDASPHYPSSYGNENIIAVASITSTGGLSSFSNYGATSVDIGAPGSSIQSTLPVSSKGNVVSGYGAYSGTSMATPHVSGAAALYASTRPGSTWQQIRDAILNNATPTASLAGKCTTGDRLNVTGF